MYIYLNEIRIGVHHEIGYHNMKRNTVFLISILLAFVWFPHQGLAIDFFFEPDTTFGDVTDTVLISGRIGSSDSMRGFTLYMAYDTNLIRLAEPVTPGSLVAGREGLSFGYFDHDYIPDVLEVYGTIMNPSTDFWAGPGELFQLHFEIKACGDVSITAPYAPFFVDAEGGYPSVAFHNGIIFICDRVPEEINSLMIQAEPPDSVTLRWYPVTHDTLGRPLLSPADYTIFRQQILPVEMPPVNVATVTDTLFVDSIGLGKEYIYYVITQTED